nr:SDR family oxidoreductase [Chelatococcus asaccharovorans]
MVNKVVVVVGSTSGIGLATAREFVREGAKVTICGRDEAQLRAVLEQMPASANPVLPVVCDAVDPADGARLIDTVVARHGGIDILVNNVGGAVGGRLLANSTDEEWRITFERNVVQTARLMRLAIPHMSGRPGAAMVNVASISGWVPQLASSGQYGGSKAALIFDTERWALELNEHGIRVNAVAPGAIFVEGRGWGSYSKQHPEDYAAYLAAAFPMGRLGRPEEVADVIVFLASCRSHWVNGRCVPVDGLEQPVRAERHWTGHH